MRYHPCTLLVVVTLWMLATGCTSSQKPKVRRENQQLPEEARKILDAADELWLWSIEGEGDGVSQRTPGFHGFNVLGKTQIQDKQTREELLGALYKGIEEAEFGPAACFAPRHGISATLGDETVDLVICFECLRVDVYANTEKYVIVTASPTDTFNAVLVRSGVRLAEPPAH